MTNVAIVRHKPYIKSKMHFPLQHNFRTLKNYGNENIDLSLTPLNSTLINNLKDGETYQAAFKRLYESGEFKGQLKVQGAENKQTKFLDEFLVYPPYGKITEMSIEEQDKFFNKELKALKKYFPDMIILSAHVHRDEMFHPLDDEMKELFPEGKVTPHMHVVAIPIVHDKDKGCKKISITELWKGRFSYRNFQDYMYDAVGKEYGFDRGEKHDYGEARKHLEPEAFKLQEEKKLLDKQKAENTELEHEIAERARHLEPKEHITIFNINDVLKEQNAINVAWKNEREEKALLEREKERLNQEIKERDETILTLNRTIQNQQEKLSETEKALLLEMDKTNEIFNIKFSDENLRQVHLEEAKKKIKLFDRVVTIIEKFLPELKKVCPKFIRELYYYEILQKEDLPQERDINRNKDR